MNLEKCSLIEPQLKELYDGCKKLKEDIAKHVSTYTGIKLAEVDSLMVNGGVTLGAEEAKTKGFISAIAEPIIPPSADIINISNA